MNMKSLVASLREQIITSGKSLFIEHGYHGLAMRQISEAVGVSKAALYYHFKDKEELFIAILSSNLNVIEKAIDSIQSEQNSYSKQIELFVEYVLNQPAEERAIIRLGTQEMSQLSSDSRQYFNKKYHEQFIGKLQFIFQAGINHGEFRTIDPAIATWALLGIMYPYFYPSHTVTSPLQAKTIHEILSIFMNGVKIQQVS